MIIRILAIGAIGVLLAGCSASRVEHEYGESVRQMINAQVHDPATLTDPSAAAVEGADPDMVNAAIEAFREHVARPEEVASPIVLRFGGSQGR